MTGQEEMGDAMEIVVVLKIPEGVMEN